MPPNNPNTYQQNPYGTTNNPGAAAAPPASHVPIEVAANHTPRMLIVALVAMTFIALGALGFAIVSFLQAQDYKNNVDQKIQAAVIEANKKQEGELKATFAEQEKSPLKSYTAPAQYDSVKIVYPKTWSAQVTEGQGGTPVNAFFHPNYIPEMSGKTPIFVRLQVIDTPYASELNKYRSQVQSGQLKATAFSAEQVPKTVGIKLTGAVASGKNGAIVLLPVRDRTIKVWAETDSALNDFNNIVLKNLSFTP